MSQEPEIMVPLAVASRTQTLSVCPKRIWEGSVCVDSIGNTFIRESWPPATREPVYIFNYKIAFRKYPASPFGASGVGARYVTAFT